MISFTIEGLDAMPVGNITIHYTNNNGVADKSAGEKKLIIAASSFSAYQPDSIKKYFDYNGNHPNLIIALDTTSGNN